MTSSFCLIEHLGRGNPAHYQEDIFVSSNSTIIGLQRFMHCRKQWDINWQAVRGNLLLQLTRCFVTIKNYGHSDRDFSSPQPHLPAICS